MVVRQRSFSPSQWGCQGTFASASCRFDPNGLYTARKYRKSRTGRVSRTTRAQVQWCTSDERLLGHCPGTPRQKPSLDHPRLAMARHGGGLETSRPYLFACARPTYSRPENSCRIVSSLESIRFWIVRSPLRSCQAMTVKLVPIAHARRRLAAWSPCVCRSHLTWEKTASACGDCGKPGAFARKAALSSDLTALRSAPFVVVAVDTA
jgi:hypothetical protein